MMYLHAYALGTCRITTLILRIQIQHSRGYIVARVKYEKKRNRNEFLENNKRA